MDSTTLLIVPMLFCAVACLAMYHLSLGRVERALLRETSRFPLFAARDALVGLVASEQMSEDEPAWRNAYQGVNSLLGLHQSFHLVDMLSRYARHVIRLETDVRYKQQFQRLLNLEQEASGRIPSFASAAKAIDEAFAYMVRKRTRAVHVLVVVAVCAVLIVVRTFLTAGGHVAAIVASSIRKPEGIDARYFGVQAC